jgi:hypothetical protein
VCELDVNQIDIVQLRRRSLELGPELRPAFEAVFERWLAQIADPAPIAARRAK